MKKALLALIVIAAVIIIGWLVLRPDSVEAVSGSVVSVDLSSIAFDGPAIITIEADDGSRQEIHVPSFGLALCAAKDNIADVYTMKAGDKIEVNGTRDEDGAIVPCAEDDHYLRVTSSATAE